MRATTEAPDIRRVKRRQFSVPLRTVFAAADPLLGTDGIGGSFATRLGDMLIQAGRYDRVIFVPLRGGASLAFLNGEGVELTTNGIAKLKAQG